MSLNNSIQTTRPPVSEVVQKLRDGIYFVDNSFQRRLVWTEKQKARLIETILMNYPIPEIYIWDQGADPESGTQKYSIVDGQQRLTALVQFISNEFALKTSYLDDDNKTAAWADAQWKDLSDLLKKHIWEYVLNVRTIPSAITPAEITVVFTRLNETDKSLNPQEMRNAEFNGEFIKAAEILANNEFWRRWGIFKESEIRRMGDIEFTSGLLIFARKGIVSDSPKALNEIYDSYNDKYEEKEKDIALIQSFLVFLEKQLQSHAILGSFFTKPNNIYSLFCALEVMKLRGQFDQFSVEKLCRFVEVYESAAENEFTADYREGSSSRTRSKVSREKRIFGLINFILAA